MGHADDGSVSYVIRVMSEAHICACACGETLRALASRTWSTQRAAGKERPLLRDGRSRKVAGRQVVPQRGATEDLSGGV